LLIVNGNSGKLLALTIYQTDTLQR